MLHRDIKPENMLLNKSLTLKICDFGFSRTLTSYARTYRIGTPIYMAPEVFLKGLGYTERCDIYSWALSFWRCFTGEYPFADCGEDRAKLNAEKQKPGRTLPDIPNISNLSMKMNEIIQNCVIFYPKKRPSMEDVIELFEAMLRNN